MTYNSSIPSADLEVPTEEAACKTAQAQSLTERLQITRLPVCPMLRSAGTKWYAVDGYCVIEGSPGRLMIPTLDTFHGYCTTARFCHCPWYRAS